MLIRDLESWLLFGHTFPRRIQYEDIHGFLQALPSLTRATFESLVIAGCLENIKILLGRGMSFEVTGYAISGLGSRQQTPDPMKTLSDLLRLSPSNFPFSPNDIAAALRWCDDSTASQVLFYYLERMEPSAVAAGAIQMRERFSPGIREIIISYRNDLRKKVFHNLLTHLNPDQIYDVLKYRNDERDITRDTVKALQMNVFYGIYNLLFLVDTHGKIFPARIRAEGMLSILATYPDRIVALLCYHCRISKFMLAWPDVELNIHEIKSPYQSMVKNSHFATVDVREEHGVWKRSNTLAEVRNRLWNRESIRLTVIYKDESANTFDRVDWEGLSSEATL
ncbi:HET domain-containing protein [Colletotrichum acutatum]